MGLTGNRTAGKPGFKIGSSEEQQPIYYWPVTWHPRGAFHLGDCNRSPCASQSAHLLNAHAAKGRGKIPQLSCQSSNCTSAKAVGKFSKPLKLQLGLHSFWIFSYLPAPVKHPHRMIITEHKEESAERGQVCPSLEGVRNEPCKLESSWMSQT